MTSECIKNFNDILDSFLAQVSSLIGSSYHHKFQLIIKCDSKLVLEQFMIHALPLRDKILNRDESYFTDENNYSDKVGNDNIGEILNFKKIYEQLDNDSKSNVWDIVQALLMVGEDYIKLKY